MELLFFLFATGTNLIPQAFYKLIETLSVGGFDVFLTLFIIFFLSYYSFIPLLFRITLSIKWVE